MTKLKDLLSELAVRSGKIQTMKDNPPFKTPHQIHEVGASQEHKKYIKNIYKAQEVIDKALYEYKVFLQEQGQKDAAMELSSKYNGHAAKFYHWFKTKWVRMIRKMI